MPKIKKEIRLKLTKSQAREFLRDGQSAKRRQSFSAGRFARLPSTFEEYIAILDDLQAVFPVSPDRRFVIYSNAIL